MTLPLARLGTIVQGDVIERLSDRSLFPDGSVQCAVTSSPYWGLRDYRQPGQGGLEPTFAEHRAWTVAWARELKRALRDDGTFWFQYGDGWAANRTYQVRDNKHVDVGNHKGARVPDGLKPKDLIGMAWDLAFALRADGWYLRQCIIWAKGESFNPERAGSVMPESVTDRATQSHEYLFLLTKRPRYFYDAVAVREGATGTNHGRRLDGERSGEREGNRPGTWVDSYIPPDRNLRSVWSINPQAYPGAHFATFPEALVRPCILAGTSGRPGGGACPACGAPWARSTRTERSYNQRKKESHVPGAAPQMSSTGWRQQQPPITLGWRPTCECGREDTVPCVVLDPFAGSGTTLRVAYQLGRAAIGIDLAGGDADLGGHTAHERIRAAMDGAPDPARAAVQAQRDAAEAEAMGQVTMGEMGVGG